MVMLPPLFDGTKPEMAKQHYERFNQYTKELEHIRKCDPPAARLPTLTQGAAVPSLYSHVAQSEDNKEKQKFPNLLKG